MGPLAQSPTLMKHPNIAMATGKASRIAASHRSTNTI